MKRALLLPLLLAACVSEEIPDSERVDGLIEGPSPAEIAAATGTPVTVDGTTLYALQKYDWPSMIAPVSAETGETVYVQSGTADTVIISGSPDDRAVAIQALAVFCKRTDLTSAAFDTQFVYKDPATGDYWFDGFRCEG